MAYYNTITTVRHQKSREAYSRSSHTMVRMRYELQAGMPALPGTVSRTDTYRPGSLTVAILQCYNTVKLKIFDRVGLTKWSNRQVIYVFRNGRVWVPQANVNYAVWRKLLLRMTSYWHERTRRYKRVVICRSDHLIPGVRQQHQKCLAYRVNYLFRFVGKSSTPLRRLA